MTDEQIEAVKVTCRIGDARMIIDWLRACDCDRAPALHVTLETDRHIELLVVAYGAFVHQRLCDVSQGPRALRSAIDALFNGNPDRLPLSRSR